MNEQQAATGKAEPDREKPGATRSRSFWTRRPVILVGTLLLGVILFWGVRYIGESMTHESTDDAFLDARVEAIAPKVAGQIQKVHVNDNQSVEAGAALVEIDPRDFQVQLEQRQAAVKAAEATVASLKANFELGQAQVNSAKATAQQSAAEAGAAQATAERARADLKRAEELMANRTISPQEYDTAKANATAMEENVRAAQAKSGSDQSKVAEAEAQAAVNERALERGRAQLRQSELDVEAAELSLSYTRVAAPEAGKVTKKAVAVGDYVQAGQRLMALVPRALYVTANFKETQLQQLRTNQVARITIDSVNHEPFRGHVESIMAGSGAAFSLLPPENAVGNFVKVVQRIPVKIVFDEPLIADHPLGPGMSVVPVVKVGAWELAPTAAGAIAAVLAILVGALWWRAATRRTA